MSNSKLPFFEHKHLVNGEHTYDNYLSDEPDDFILIEVICFLSWFNLEKRLPLLSISHL